MHRALFALLAAALSAGSPGDAQAGSRAKRGVVKKAVVPGQRGPTVQRTGSGRSLRGVLAPARRSAVDPMTVTPRRDARGRVRNRDEVEAAARALMGRSPSTPAARRATWLHLLSLADGTRFRDKVIRAAFHMTARGEWSEFGMHFATARRGRGLPDDVHKAIYGYKPMSPALSTALNVVTWPIYAAMMIIAGDQ